MNNADYYRSSLKTLSNLRPGTASDKQKSFIDTLCKQRGMKSPDMDQMSMHEATQTIEKLLHPPTE